MRSFFPIALFRRSTAISISFISKLYVGTAFSKGRWNVSTGLQYVAGLYKELDPEETEDFLLWNVRGSFRVLDGFDVWVKGENLLAQRYYINSLFPIPKATVMAGVNIKF